MRNNKYFVFLFLGLLGSSAAPAQNYLPGYKYYQNKTI